MRLITTAFGLLLALTLTACGGGASTPAPTTSPTAVATNTSSLVAPQEFKTPATLAHSGKVDAQALTAWRSSWNLRANAIKLLEANVKLTDYCEALGSNTWTSYKRDNAGKPTQVFYGLITDPGLGVFDCRTAKPLVTVDLATLAITGDDAELTKAFASNS